MTAMTANHSKRFMLRNDYSERHLNYDPHRSRRYIPVEDDDPNDEEQDESPYNYFDNVSTNEEYYSWRKEFEEMLDDAEIIDWYNEQNSVNLYDDDDDNY